MVTGDGTDFGAQRDAPQLLRRFDDPVGAVAALTTKATMLPGVTGAAVTIVVDAEVRTVAATTEVLLGFDAAQLSLGLGPCVLAAATESVVHCDDLATDERWPGLVDAAIAAGVGAMVSVPIYADAVGFAVFSAFSRHREGIDAATRAAVELLATHAATALMAVDRRARIAAALTVGDEIGQAKGIVMERFDVDAVRAFELLVELARDADISMGAVARQIIDTTVRAGST